MDKEEKYRRSMKCLDQWMTIHERNKYVSDYLKHFEYKNIGVYGYGMLGKHLVSELQKKKFPIKWVMDKSASGDEIYSHIIRNDDKESCKDVDVAVITTLTDIEEIEMFLFEFVTGNIISIEELINNIYCWGLQG